MAELFDILKYSTDKQTVLDLGTVSQTVASTTIVGAVAGTYELGYAFSANFNGSKGSPLFHSISGTYANPTEHAIVAEANADHKNVSYAFPIVHAGGDLTMALDMRKDPGIGLLDVDWVDVVIKRVA